MEEKCTCCGRKYEEKLNWHFTLPDVGYGSLFDRVDPEAPIQMTICTDCFEKINHWLKKKDPQLKLQEFWKFEVVDKSEVYNAPTGYIKEIKHEETLYDMIMKFMPQVYYDKKDKPVRWFFTNIWDRLRKRG